MLRKALIIILTGSREFRKRGITLKAIKRKEKIKNEPAK